MLNMREFPRKFLHTKLLMIHFIIVIDQWCSLQAKKILWYVAIAIIGLCNSLACWANDSRDCKDFQIFCSLDLQFGNHPMAVTECVIILGRTMSK